MRARVSRIGLINALAVLALGAGCAAGVSAPGQPAGIAVMVDPPSTVLGPGASASFAAQVTGTADTAVSWSVSSGGGTIDQTGAYVAPATAGVYRVVAASHADPTKTGTAVVTVTSGQTGTRVLGTWAGWQLDAYPADRVDYGAVTHLLVAHWLSVPDGTVRPGWPFDQRPEVAQDVVNRTHAAGRKAIMMLGGADDPNFLSATAPQNLSRFVTSCLAEMDRFGFDGIQVDWENNFGPTKDQLVAFVQALRAARPTMILEVPVLPIGRLPTDEYPALGARLAPHVDQIGLMTFAIYWPWPGGTSQTFAPLYGPGGIDGLVAAFLGAGVPREKLSIGIGFYGLGFSPPVTGPNQPWGASHVVQGEIAWGDIMNRYRPLGTLGWEDVAKQPYLTLDPAVDGMSWITFEDPTSIAEKAAFARAQQLGGVIIWTINEGVTSRVTFENPMLAAVKASFLP